MIPKTMVALSTVLTLLILCHCASNADDGNLPEVSFARQIRPIFNQHCIACHGGIKQAAGFTFVYRESVVGTASDSEKPVVASSPDDSELMARITDEDDELRMPPAEHGERLSDEEIALIRQWIAQGALWEPHWAFVPPEKLSLPEVSRPQWCESELDRFVLAELDRQGLRPAPPADPAEWLRRVTFDLTGLPPSEVELDQFLADPSRAAMEAAVDRLLASARFGERWATPWLDVARYSDTMGFEKDPPRTIWPYRDWVIRALNQDLPLDAFTIKQLAGDLLPEATIGDLLATGFHRNTQANTEGGTDDEEFRIAAVIDRANTTAQAWLGLTLGCAQCHDHPYEPITNEEYYRFLAFFNNTRDYDVPEEFPRVPIPRDESDWETASRLDHQIAAAQESIQHELAQWFADDARWSPATIESASATGSTVLEVGSVAGISEFRTTDQLSSGSNYTLDCAIPDGISRLTALRLDALTLDEDFAARIPQTGFILSQLKVFVVEPGKDAQSVPLELGFGDDPNPFYSVAESLDPNLPGWACYPRQSQTSRAIFVPTQPVHLSDGCHLQVVLEHQSGSEHLFQMRRGRVWLSGDDFWTDLARPEGLATSWCKLTELQAQRSRIESISMPVMAELAPELSRTTRVFHRGNFLDPTVDVEPGVPVLFPPIAESDRPLNRLDLAQWLVVDENPLTARVFVNRIWSELFGTGIVETIENFGSSGTPPSNHPLLDHLAVKVQGEFGWSLKRLLREIVLSNTYMQTAAVAPKSWEFDPRNRWLSRGPRNRLTAEMIRDQALALSGQLSEKMYGPPVMPPQPEGLWQSAYSGETWNTSTGEDRYRRAIYTYYKRTSGYPAYMAFDAPTRDVCVVDRVDTNTPLQALVTLNDEAFVELAVAFGRRMRQSTAATTQDKIAWGYRLATSRPPSPEKLAGLVALWEQASEVATSSGGPTDNPADPYAVVAAVLMNLDEALTK